MAKGFYLKLAFANIKRSKAIYLPYAIATAIISGVYFLVNMLRYSPGISGVPSGEAAQAVFMFTSVFISLFTFIFMMYINTPSSSSAAKRSSDCMAFWGWKKGM